jgi:release factor glutamine methyltransferase
MPQSDAASAPHGPLPGASATISSALREGIAVLSESSGSARADAFILLAHVLGQPREWIVAHGEAKLSDADAARFVDLCDRRRDGEPVPYITGRAWFYGREFIVDESVLIPRPETEHLVDEAVDFMRSRAGVGRVLDVGTGSGAIACSVAAETAALVDGTDLSPEAVGIARLNAQRIGVGDRCRFRQGDLATPVSDRRYDLVLANLPYVPTGDLPEAPEPASFEPRVALDGGSDGLAGYRRLLPRLPALLDAKALILFEAAPPTIAHLVCLARDALPGYTITIGHDYAGLARYLKAERKTQ